LDKRIREGVALAMEDDAIEDDAMEDDAMEDGAGALRCFPGVGLGSVQANIVR
jgi:hypothetical protein